MKLTRLLVASFFVLSSYTAVAAESSSQGTVVASATTVSSDAASATEAGVQGSSTAPAEQKSTARSTMDSLYLSYFGTFHGASLKNADSAQTVNRFGVQQKKSSNFTNVNFDSEVGAGYMMTKDVGFGVVVPFIYIPVNGQAMVLGDVGVKVTDKHLVRANGFNLYANLIAQAPTSASSQDRDQKWALKSTPALAYAVPHSSFTVGSWNELKYYSGVVKDKTFKLWTAPYVRYNLSEKFALNVQYEMEWHHDVGQRGFFTFSSYQQDLQPGVVWNITPKIMVNPYLQIFTTDKVSADNTAIGAVLSAAIL